MNLFEGGDRGMLWRGWMGGGGGWIEDWHGVADHGACLIVRKTHWVSLVVESN